MERNGEKHASRQRTVHWRGSKWQHWLFIKAGRAPLLLLLPLALGGNQGLPLPSGALLFSHPFFLFVGTGVLFDRRWKRVQRIYRLLFMFKPLEAVHRFFYETKHVRKQTSEFKLYQTIWAANHLVSRMNWLLQNVKMQRDEWGKPCQIGPESKFIYFFRFIKYGWRFLF